VNFIVSNPNTDVVIARHCIAEALRHIQFRRWTFNTDKCVTLHPTVPSGEILLPPHVLRVTPVGNNAGQPLVQIQGKLRNRVTQSMVFTTPVTVDLQYLYPYEDIPEVARYAAVTMAARMFQARSLGSQTVQMFTAEDEKRAWVALEEHEAATGHFNIFSDNRTVAGTFIRHRRF
jgi:hypothetical protein